MDSVCHFFAWPKNGLILVGMVRTSIVGKRWYGQAVPRKKNKFSIFNSVQFHTRQTYILIPFSKCSGAKRGVVKVFLWWERLAHLNGPWKGCVDRSSRSKEEARHRQRRELLETAHHCNSRPPWMLRKRICLFFHLEGLAGRREEVWHNRGSRKERDGCGASVENLKNNNLWQILQSSCLTVSNLANHLCVVSILGIWESQLCPPPKFQLNKPGQLIIILGQAIDHGQLGVWHRLPCPSP